MSRSRHPRKRRPNQRTDEERFPERYLRVPDPPGLGELREALAIAEVIDGTLEAIDVPDGDHTSREAVILAVIDAKTRHHRRPRRRRPGSRKFSAWRFLKLLSNSYAPVGKPGPVTVQAPRPTS